MANYAEHFAKTAHKSKFEIGDRIFGYYQKIPFVGSVGNDRVISPITGPEVTVHLDLPIRLGEITHNVIIVKHKDIKKLTVWD